MAKIPSEPYAEIMNLGMGESLTYSGLTWRQLNDRRAVINYYFQGTLKPQDNRLNDPNFTALHDLSWDWRIEDSFERNPDNKAVWDLKLTKVETPDKWKYDGKELQLVLAKRFHEQKWAEADAKLTAIQAAKPSKE